MDAETELINILSAEMRKDMGFDELDAYMYKDYQEKGFLDMELFRKLIIQLFENQGITIVN